MEQTIELSVVLPAYNEEARLGPTLERIVRYLTLGGRSFEIIVVDDGSTDGTVRLAEDWAKRDARIRLVRNKENKGKGFSVRNGMMRARGEQRLFSDADLSTPIEEVEKLMRALEDGADMAIGSRSVEGADVQVHQPWYRECMGKTFNLLVRLLFATDIRDTQCGFKLFTRQAAEALFPKACVNRFGFDVELVFLAQKLGFSVVEVPVVWRNDEHSKVSAIADSVDMFLDLIRIRWRLRR